MAQRLLNCKRMVIPAHPSVSGIFGLGHYKLSVIQIQAAMVKSALLLFMGWAILISFQSPPQTAKAEKWVSLFNGRNLEGWTPKFAGYPPGQNFGNTFRVANGILST